MHAENLRRVLVGQRVDLLDPIREVVRFSHGGNVLEPRTAEFVGFFLVDVGGELDAQHAADGSEVQFFCHSATVGDLADHVLDCVLRDDFPVAEFAQRIQTCDQVTLVEVLKFVESQGTLFFALQNDCMEEHGPEH